MDHSIPLISIVDLRSRVGTLGAPIILDVRREKAYGESTSVLASARRASPDEVGTWGDGLPKDRQVVVYCVHGHEVSQSTAHALRALGVDACYLEGGFSAWQVAGGPVIFKRAELGVPSQPNTGSCWITRQRPKIDRIACPWLIRRFVDPAARFLYVPSDKVVAEAKRLGAIPYDIPAVRFTHRGEHCSFDAFIADFALTDPALAALADIVRAADTGHPEHSPRAGGLLAISLGLSAMYSDDHQMLEAAMPIYDALYAWAKSAQDEIHNAALFEGNARASQ